MDLLERLAERESRKRHTAASESDRKRLGAFLTVVVVFAAVFTAGMIYVSKSNTIYFWDDSTYWDMGRAVADGDLKGDFLRKVYDSIGADDYNYLAALPSAAWMTLFGQSRVSYVAGLLIMYVLPFFVLVYSLAKKLSKAPRFAFAASVFMIPATAFLAFSGFVDVGGLLIIAACYNLYYTRDGTANEIWRYIVIGILLVLLMVFRKYFAFFSVSFLTAMAMDCILFKRKWRNLIAAGASAAILLCTVFMPFLTGILLKNYVALYEGYSYSVGTDMRLITRYFGMILPLLLFIVPFASAARRQEYRPIFAWIQMLVCALMFMATQTHGQQHLTMYIPSLTVLVLFLTNVISKQWMLIAVCLLACVNSVNTYIPREQPGNIQDIDHMALIPDFSMLPKHREDTEAVLALKRDLDRAVPEGKHCGVLSSSFLLNDSILRNVEPSIRAGITRDPDYIVGLPEVDSRDSGRLEELYTADYILVASPAQTHLAAGEQTIVDEAVASFENGTDIAESFEEVAGFARELDGFTVRLYERVDDVGLYQRSLFEPRLFY